MIGSTGVCKQRQTYECALGFLLSYVALIQHESDFYMAREAHLIPTSVTWPKWVALAEQLLDAKNLGNINERYRFGELRLTRLNKIYTYCKFVYRGYSSWYRTYSEFIQDNVAPIAAAVGYIALVLTAMQVGLSTDKLKENVPFQNASYGFTVFSILGPLAFFAFLAVALMFFSFDNVWRTHNKKKERFAIYDQRKTFSSQP
jgi:hypothetical protein